MFPNVPRSYEPEVEYSHNLSFTFDKLPREVVLHILRMTLEYNPSLTVLGPDFSV